MSRRRGIALLLLLSPSSTDCHTPAERQLEIRQHVLNVRFLM